MRKTVTLLPFVLISVNSFADGIITQNIQNGCNTDNLLPIINNQASIRAIWQRNSYTCAPGYFLPANAVECAQCSVDHICNGGTYDFYENVSQGIALNPIITTDFAGGCTNDVLLPKNGNTNVMATWEVNSYNCGAGFYLPADGIECVICPNNNYCPGGKYSYSETDVQGITACPSGLVSPIGATDMGGCGYKLHIGDEVIYLRSQKKTSPLINVDIDGDGVPDFFGNLTPKKTFMNRDSNLFLHVGDYYMYDDSITPGEYVPKM